MTKKQDFLIVTWIKIIRLEMWSDFTLKYNTYKIHTYKCEVDDDALCKISEKIMTHGDDSILKMLTKLSMLVDKDLP